MEKKRLFPRDYTTEQRILDLFPEGPGNLEMQQIACIAGWTIISEREYSARDLALWWLNVRLEQGLTDKLSYKSQWMDHATEHQLIAELRVPPEDRPLAEQYLAELVQTGSYLLGGMRA